jgi:N-acyl homoserine lactone hydrolase
MTATLFAFTCGHVTGKASGFLEGEAGALTVPAPVFLIEHEQGRVLFDTGVHPGTRQDKARYLGKDAPNWTIDLPQDADPVAQLARLGLKPSDIRTVVNSHLHFDHCGCNHCFPDAVTIVQAKEWRAAQRPNTQAAGIYNPLHYEGITRWREIDGELDLFGDGAVVVFPTPGHTPGHQSLRVETASGPVVLAADCCYLKRTLDDLHLPGTLYNREQMLATLMELRRMQGDGARIFFGHDPEFWQTVPQAPLPVL